jgi:hypothetical protein
MGRPMSIASRQLDKDSSRHHVVNCRGSRPAFRVTRNNESRIHFASSHMSSSRVSRAALPWTGCGATPRAPVCVFWSNASFANTVIRQTYRTAPCRRCFSRPRPSPPNGRRCKPDRTTGLARRRARSHRRLSLQTRGSLEPRQDHDSSFVQESTSERVATPRYPAAAIDCATCRGVSPRCAPTDRDRLKRPGSSTVLTYASANSRPMPGTLMSSWYAEFDLTSTRIALSKTAICLRNCRTRLLAH